MQLSDIQPLLDAQNTLYVNNRVPYSLSLVPTASLSMAVQGTPDIVAFVAQLNTRLAHDLPTYRVQINDHALPPIVPTAPPRLTANTLNPTAGSAVTFTIDNVPTGAQLIVDTGQTLPAGSTVKYTYTSGGTRTVTLTDSAGTVLGSLTLNVAAAPAVTLRERDPDKLPWTAAIYIDENNPATLTPYLQTDGSLRLTNKFPRSDNPNVMPVRWKTSRPVIIEGGASFGKGQPLTGAFGALFCDYPNAHLTIREHIVYGTNPGVTGYCPVRAICLPYGFRHLDVLGFEMYGAGGVALIRDDSSSVRIDLLRYSRVYVKNLDGRVADTSKPGGWRTGNKWGNGLAADFVISNILQLVDVRMDMVDELDISHIEMENEAGKSRFEDAFAFQRSGGSDTKEMLLQYIKMRGAYVYDEAYDGTQPWYGNNGPIGTGGNASVDETGRYKDARGKVHSGGMGLFGDGVSNTTPLSKISRNVRFFKVVALDFANYGLAIHSGVKATLDDVLVARSGFVHSLGNGRQVKIPTKHLPIQLQYGPGSPVTSDRWGGHLVKNSRFGQTSFDPLAGGLIRHEGANADGSIFKITPNTTENGASVPAFKEVNNTYLPNVTADDCDAYWRELDAYWHTHGIAVGLADRIPAMP